MTNFITTLEKLGFQNIPNGNMDRNEWGFENFKLVLTKDSWYLMKGYDNKRIHIESGFDPHNLIVAFLDARSSQANEQGQA
ncbi:hypothetical protein LX99_01484 [Mucilaginibacter oryzae]|uniref:Uncharacterized protein n=1 Tax=Mucilaginibacter oryzae TaxID=468058 RepID=A0A316HCT8_9SPHI|nr:hypothetical protein [Mucilaginibacter oryzae]PWK79029.1 hypothetical protein LX99_01484 [Mucilaginibacter oryzae]